MYIIKRTSWSGGEEYLIEAVNSRYRFEKKTKKLAHRFASRSHAYQLASDSDARVEKVPVRKSKARR